MSDIRRPSSVEELSQKYEPDLNAAEATSKKAEERRRRQIAEVDAVLDETERLNKEAIEKVDAQIEAEDTAKEEGQ